MMTDFDDLEGDLDADTRPGAPSGKKYEKRVEKDRAETLYSETCTRCNGSGLYRFPGVPCFLCNGKGVRLFKTPKAQREKSRESAARRAERKAEENLAATRRAQGRREPRGVRVRTSEAGRVVA